MAESARDERRCSDRMTLQIPMGQAERAGAKGCIPLMVAQLSCCSLLLLVSQRCDIIASLGELPLRSSSCSNTCLSHSPWENMTDDVWCKDLDVTLPTYFACSLHNCKELLEFWRATLTCCVGVKKQSRCTQNAMDVLDLVCFICARSKIAFQIVRQLFSHQKACLS